MPSESKTRPYWVSWWATDATGPFTLNTPWWVSGYRYDSDDEEQRSICAALVAESDADARAQIVAAHDKPSDLEWRFVTERGADWSPLACDRFQRAEWMQWPPVPR